MAPKELPDTKEDTRAQSKLIEIRTIFMDLLRYNRLSEMEKDAEDAEEKAAEQRFVEAIQRFAPTAVPKQARPADTARIEAQLLRTEQLCQQILELQQENESLYARIRSMSTNR